MKRFYTISTIVIILLVSCKKSDYQYVDVEEGLDTSVELLIDASATNGTWNEATKAYQLTPSEESQIKTIDILIFNSAQNLVSRTRLDNPNSTVRVNTKTGVGMSIYAVANSFLIANASPTSNDVLGQATTVSQLKNIKVTNLLVDVENNKTLMMSGFVENVTISPSGSAVTVPLSYVAAKVTVNFYSTLPIGEYYDLVDWRLGNFAKFSYIFPASNDAVNVANSNDFVTQSAGNTWTDGSVTVSGTTYPAKTASFYVFENRRGVTSNNDPMLKSGSTAPTMSTYLLAKGFYKTLLSVKAVNSIIMLGANSTNNYNVERKKQYVYNVNVKGFNNFNVDTRYIDGGTAFQAEIVNPILDAHYDYRPLRIGAFQGVSTVTILDENGLPTTSSFWLKASLKNITKFINNGSGVYVRPTYNPTTEMVQTILALNHPDPSAITYNMVYLYADEYLTDGGTRTAKVRIVYTPVLGGLPITVTTTVTQRGCQVAGNVGLRAINSSGTQTTTNYKLGMELFEEATMAITPGNISNERTSSMQWGYTGNSRQNLSPFTLRNGYENTINLVLSGNNLRAPYGRASSGTISEQVHDPIFNSYAARYCFEKNRDTNGDGNILGSEIKWYLPSNEELLLMYVAEPAWSQVASEKWGTGTIYQSSTEYDENNNMGTIFTTGITGTLPKNSTVNVRCIRAIN